MPTDLSSIYMLTSIITGSVGTLTLIVTLGIVAWQTTHTAKQTKLNTIISYYQYLKDVNIVLLFTTLTYHEAAPRKHTPPPSLDPYELFLQPM